jgi:hypothetical protein
MSQPFDEPKVLADFDRSFGERYERLVLEKGEYRGRPTYCLRVLWRNQAGEWRWSAAKPSSTGRTWQALNVRARELRALGQVLMAEADELERGGAPAAAPAPRTKRASPREQREIERFEAEHPPFKGGSDVPF